MPENSTAFHKYQASREEGDQYEVGGIGTGQRQAHQGNQRPAEKKGGTYNPGAEQQPPPRNACSLIVQHIRLYHGHSIGYLRATTSALERAASDAIIAGKEKPGRRAAW